MTNSPHVLFFRPLIRLLAGGRARGRGDGARVRPDARPARAARHPRTTSSAPGTAEGAGSARRGRSCADCRAPPLRPRARFDLALAHGSHEAMLAARSLRIPGARPTTTSTRRCSTTSASAPRRASSSRTPSRRQARPLRRPAAEARPVPGLEEEYYLADFDPDRRVLAGIDPTKVLAVVDPPDSRSTTGTATRSSRACSSAWAATSPSTRSSCPGRPSSGARSRRSPSPRSTSRSGPSTRSASWRWPTSSSRRAGR